MFKHGKFTTYLYLWRWLWGPVKSAATFALDIITYRYALWDQVKSATALALDMITYNAIVKFTGDKDVRQE